MQYTFDILISGCNTRCEHCYVGGGGAPAMELCNVKFAIQKLKEILDGIEGEHIYLDYEIFNHPHTCEILRLFKETVPQFFPFEHYGIPTSGIALMGRNDKKEIIDTLKHIECKTFTLTIHGDKEYHNEITKNQQSYNCILETANFLEAEGFDIELNLMLNRFLIEDFKKIIKIVNLHPKAFINLTIPNYMPTSRLRGFQKYRAQYADIKKIQGELNDLRINVQEFMHRVESYNENRVLKHGRAKLIISRKTKNKKIGNFLIWPQFGFILRQRGRKHSANWKLKKHSANELRNQILLQGANYDWSAFYNLKSLPPIQQVLQSANKLTTNYVYNSACDCLYSWFDACKVPSLLIIGRRQRIHIFMSLGALH